MENQHPERTESQKAASRANGQKSRGPITEEGKRISSRNACKHGLLANCLLVEPESRRHFDALLNSLVATFDPQDAAERMHLETLASARWQLSRIWSARSAALNYELRIQAPDTPNEDAATRVMLAMRALEKNDTSQRALSLDEHRYESQQRHALQALDRLKRRKKAENFIPPEGTWKFDENKELFAENEPENPQNEPEKRAIDPEPGPNDPENKPEPCGPDFSPAEEPGTQAVSPEIDPIITLNPAEPANQEKITN